MSKLQLFKDFVNERLAAAALEIFGQYEKTLEECQEEICRSAEKNTKLQRMLDLIQPKIKLHRTDVQQLSTPEPPRIKEEQDLWTSQGEEQLQELQSDTTDSMFTSPRVKTHCDPEDSSQLPPLDQISTVDNRERDSLSTNTTEEQIKAESHEEDCGAPEPASDSQPPSVTPDCPTAQSLKEERGGLLPDLKPIKSRRTEVKCSRHIPNPCSSPGPCLRTKTSPWTRPISSSRSGSESEDVSSGEAESETAEKPYQCEECDKAFSKKGNFIRHRRIHTGEKPYQCQECAKAFRCKSHLVSHRRIHTGEKPYQCEECDKAFSEKISLVNHRRIHTGEKPYQCEECDKAFSDQSSFIKHRRIHTGEKPYQCQGCDKAFTCKSHLVSHSRIHTGEKSHQCEECGKAFSHKGNLVVHRRIHTGEKSYQCEECDKAFGDQSGFVKHRRIHTGEKPYPCQGCDKAFSCKSHLVSHTRIHTGERPYQCEGCDKAFSHKGNLVVHRRIHTGEKSFPCSQPLVQPWPLPQVQDQPVDQAYSQFPQALLQPWPLPQNQDQIQLLDHAYSQFPLWK